MKLLLRRDQKAGMLGVGKISFILDVRAEVSEDEKASIKKYKLGDTTLYVPPKDKERITDMASGRSGFGSLLAHKLLNMTITADDLLNGKKIECKDIIEMMAAEEQVKQACQGFHVMLTACRTFGGEEVIEIT